MFGEQQDDSFMEAWAKIVKTVKYLISNCFNKAPFMHDYINIFKTFDLDH